MERLISRTFRSLKPPPSIPNHKPSKLTLNSSKHSSHLAASSSAIPEREAKSSKSSSAKPNWSVYLILSTNTPIKTYVGITTNFSRRLKQHNGELKGGAKASRAGRPWVCACTIRGFKNKSEACKFETQWKNCSRKLPCKKKNDEEAANTSIHLLLHRHAALSKLNESTDFSHLKVVWKLNPL